MSSDKRQVIDYFIVAGLPDEQKLLQEFPQKPTHMKWPIIDVAVINKSKGELPPKGFECLELTPSGHPANLNHGSVMASELFLWFRRGWDKPPIIDLGVMYASKHLPKVGSQVLTQTPYGRSANVNNTFGEKIYINYVRADETAASDSFAVVDICIILPAKNEGPPHGFLKIERNLNKGLLGSAIFLCYKKSSLKNNSLNYEAGVLFRYPSEDLPGCPFPQQVAMFCLPLGATIESWPAGSRHPLPLFSTFVLTGATGEKIYGANVMFYEEYDESKLRKEQLSKLGLLSPCSPEQQLSVHQNQSICILSRWPFFDAFKKFLLCLYRMSVSGPQKVPLERHIGHFMSEVPFPSRERPRILVQLSTESVSLLSPEETPLPKSGASLVQMLMTIGPHNIICLVFYILMEHRILIDSLRPERLTSVTEAVVSMIFPFRWQYRYIPLCPLQLGGVLNSPTPFIIGLDSRYFDMFDPPSDITFVALDTWTITVSEERKCQNPSILPERPVKVLRSALEELYEQILNEMDRQGGLGGQSLMENKTVETFEMSIQEAFLRFMASLLAGYDKFLLPVTGAPTDVATKDVKSLFSIEGFLNSREEAHRDFYRQMMKTQYFSRFIEERCFVSDENIGLAFFDECIRKYEEQNDCTLLDFDERSCLSETTVCVIPTEPSTATSDILFSYKGFSQLQPDLFVQNSNKKDVEEETSTSIIAAGSVLRRTKQEVKSFRKALIEFADQAEPMAKCFAWTCYSLWFMCLPSHILNVSSEIRLLEDALGILRQMHQLQMKPLDEVCYRILMHLCCNYNHPALAVKIYHEMKQNQIHPNAITYGFYNKAVVESHWSSSVTVGTRMWKKLRNVIFATVRFRILYREKTLRKNFDIFKNQDGLFSGYVSHVNEKLINTEFVEKDSRRIVHDQKVCDARVTAELLVNYLDSVCERDCNQKSEQNVCDSDETLDLADHIESKSSDHLTMTTVTKNDPLGVFGLMSLQAAHGACSADSLSIEQGRTTLTTKQLNDSLTGEYEAATAGFDSTESVPAFEFGSGIHRYNGLAAASVEADLCTQSKCTICSNLLYDEEIMAGWSSDDSILTTRCHCCGFHFVPVIHVNLKHFHLNKGQNSVTKTDDQESTLKNKDSQNIESGVISEVQPSISQSSCLDVKDGNSISHLPNNRIQTNRFNESNDEVKFGLQLGDDFSQVPSSSLFSIDSGTEEDTGRSFCKEESFTVMYLSPLVLKKEMENMLETDGEDCLKNAQLINDHPIVYWNLVWFFRRLHLPSHLYSFIPESSVFSSNPVNESMPTGRDHVVLVRTLWDGIHTHKEYGLPMYILWKQNNIQMISENDEVMIFSKSVLQSILSCVVNHDIQLAIEKVLCERKRIRRTGKILYRSIYYDVLFLSLSVLQNDFNLKTYDVLYREACNDLSPVYSARLMEADRPPRTATICCRQLFGLLEL